MNRTSHSNGSGRDLSIESALAGAVSLIEKALAHHRDSDEERAVIELLSGEEAVTAAVLELIGQARRELFCVSAPENLSEPAVDALRGLQRSTTVNVRVLFHVPTLAGHRRLQGLAGRVQESVEMRVTDASLQELLVADRRVALISSRNETARQALVVHSPIMLRALHGLFVQSWANASPINLFARFNDFRQSETTRQILTLLRDGHKDDTAARELGMSVRTYRRHVADIMRDINATSRFQAGVRAAELKLLAADHAR